MVAVVAASAVRLIFGTAAGRPGLPEVAAALAELGIDAERARARGAPDGGCRARGRDRRGRPQARDQAARPGRLRQPAPREDLAVPLVRGRRPAAAAEPRAGRRIRGVRDAARPQLRRAGLRGAPGRDDDGGQRRCSSSAAMPARSGHFRPPSSTTVSSPGAGTRCAACTPRGSSIAISTRTRSSSSTGRSGSSTSATRRPRRPRIGC